MSDSRSRPPAADMVFCACGCGQAVATDALGKDDRAPLYIGEYGKRMRRRAVFVDDSHRKDYFAARPKEAPGYDGPVE